MPHDVDIAALLFPSETTTAPQNAPVTPDRGITMPGSDKPAPAPAARGSGDPVSDAFPSEAAPDPAASVSATLNPWADGLQADGATDRADEMRAVSEALAADFREGGMTAEDTAEVMGLAREAMGNTVPGVGVSEDRLVEMRVAAETFIAENQISADDIGLAQRLIRDLGAKTGGRVSEYLIGSGMGNDPRAIQRAVHIAKRRYR